MNFDDLSLEHSTAAGRSRLSERAGSQVNCWNGLQAACLVHFVMLDALT